MRPTFENDATKQAELEIALAVRRLMVADGRLPKTATLHKLGKNQILDYAVVNGRVIQFLECKERPTLQFGFRDGYYISMNKALRAEAIMQGSTLRPLLLLRCEGGMIYSSDIWMPSKLYRPTLIMHGPIGRNDPDDIEPEFVLPWAIFKPEGRYDVELDGKVVVIGGVAKVIDLSSGAD